MSRKVKIGLDYFPFEVDFFADIKIRKLVKYQGGKAIAVYAYLLCNIYKNGYYTRWDNELPFIISEITGYNEAYIQEVIDSCLNIGLLSKDVYEISGVLTSKGIQERYAEIGNLTKRKIIISDYNLINSEEIPISSEEMGINSEEIPINSENMPQRKEKKRKEKEYAEANASVSAAEPPTDHEAADLIDYKKMIEFFNQETGGVFGVVHYPLPPKWQGNIRARIREHSKKTFADVITKAAKSDFLKGQNKQNWRASFEWLIKPTNFQKVLAGNYDNTRPTGKSKYTERPIGEVFVIEGQKFCIKEQDGGFNERTCKGCVFWNPRTYDSPGGNWCEVNVGYCKYDQRSDKTGVIVVKTD
jgi:hypothetical protein